MAKWATMWYKFNAFSQVLEDGTYIKPENDKIVYSGMLVIRATLPLQVATMLAKGVAIAIRYSCVRRQSELTPGYAQRLFWRGVIFCYEICYLTSRLLVLSNL